MVLTGVASSSSLVSSVTTGLGVVVALPRGPGCLYFLKGRGVAAESPVRVRYEGAEARSWGGLRPNSQLSESSPLSSSGVL